MSTTDPAPASAGPPAMDAGLQGIARAARVLFHLLVICLVAGVLFFLWRRLFILRCGRMVVTGGEPTLEQGLHFSFPYPIDERLRVESKRPHTLTTDAFWYDEAAAGQPAAPDDTLRPGRDGYTLSGDRNIIHSQWTLQYTITNPVAYATDFYDRETQRSAVEDCLRVLLHAAVAEASTALPVDAVWQGGDETFRLDVEKALRRRLDGLRVGVAVDRVFCSMAPPRRVKAEFDAVSQAEEERRKLVAQAESAAQKRLSEARIEAARTLAAANTEKVQKLSRLTADAAAFARLYPQYRQDPELFRRLYVDERLRQIVSHVEETFIVDRRHNRQLRLDLSPEPRQTGKAKP